MDTETVPATRSAEFGLEPEPELVACAGSFGMHDAYAATQRLLNALSTVAPAKDREVEAAKARARNAARFGAA